MGGSWGMYGDCVPYIRHLLMQAAGRLHGNLPAACMAQACAIFTRCSRALIAGTSQPSRMESLSWYGNHLVLGLLEHAEGGCR